MADDKNMVTEFVRQELLHGRKVTLTDETDLLNAGIIDSLGILRMVSFIEEQTGLQVPDEDVVFEHFQSIRAIAEYIALRRQAQESTSA